MQNTFGQRMSEYRKQYHLTQEQVAEKLNVSPQAVSKWENDATYPDITLLKDIAKMYGVTVDKLLGEEAPLTVINTGKDINKMLLKIKVIGKEEKVSVNLPVAIIKLLLSSEASMNAIGIKGDALKGIDFNQILMMIDSGIMGKLVEVDTEDEKVEIWVE